MSAAVSLTLPIRPRVPLTFDPVLVTISAILLSGGLVVLASASIAVADKAHGDPFFYVERQVVAVLLGLAAGTVCLFVPIRFWQAAGPLALFVGLLLLLLVLVPGIGYEVNNARRWIRLGALNLQVSEPARLCLIVYLAGYLVRQAKGVRQPFWGFLRPMAVLSVACVALLAEPDFGAAVLLLGIALTMLLVAGARCRDFFVFAGLAVAAMAALAVTAPYRLRRLTSFLDPWADSLDSGFQLTQSLMAIGRGEWLGVGLGKGVQKLFYLPEAHTDFVFAVFAEEFGLLGSVLAVALFLALLWRIGLLAWRAAAAERFFAAYLTVGIGTWLGLQAFINLGVNMGLLPTKGLTLPLVSYGRSSMIVTLIALALLFRIHHELSVAATPVKRSRSASKPAPRRRS